MSEQTEAWLSGPVEGIPALLQPVAHSLLQVRGEVERAVAGFPAEMLWSRPAGVASVGFHLRHISGVVDRLFAYARGEALTPEQMVTLKGEPTADPDVTIEQLVRNFATQVDRALAQLRETDEEEITQPRAVGRRQLPSTVQGLYFHAAEHSQRHLGQLLVTVRVLLADRPTGA